VLPTASLSEEEAWRPCTEFPNHYSVSSRGIVCGRRGVLAQTRHKTGAMRVRLCVNGVKCSRSVHRMVAIAVLPNPLNKLEVNHINGVRQDNWLGNLEWTTKAENMQHAVDTGLISNPFGKKARHFKRSVVVFKHGEQLAVLNGNAEILAFGLCYKLVSACLLGKQASHRGYTFKSIGETE
jgi:hypothetical protein